MFWFEENMKNEIKKGLKPKDCEYFLDFETDENSMISNFPDYAKSDLFKDDEGDLYYNFQIVGYFNTRTRTMEIQK